MLAQALRILRPREQAVLMLHYGINTESRTFADIAKMFGLTRERVRQIETGAIKKLKVVIQKENEYMALKIF